MFSNPFKKKLKTADELLSTGELNWRLKPFIASAAGFPNLLKFITQYEDKNNLQIGLFSDSLDEFGNQCCIFSQIIYNEKNNPAFWFGFNFLYVNMANKHIAFMGNITDFMKVEERANPDQKYMAIISTERENDLSIEEYEKYFEEAYSQAMAIRLIDKNKYRRVRGDGIPCLLKLFEKEKRERFL